ncbi:hydroxymethylbilane synthase [Selenomonas sp. TAMA-11512]|uniref:hydroxymethylbilane synthase n=1 Tax=Selenomonas sp. TAMA-11512 TaxID=3095337 RepID=UPI00308AA854|nr:hydroxymethylbilane synthase [Selenomonas sp. TAMA-11512]
MKKDTVVIGTRSSALALWQANHIAYKLRTRHPGLSVVLKEMTTKGDKILDVPLAKIGGKGLFTKELEAAMLAHEIDIAVHSLKDMPTELPEGLILAAVTKRLDAGDALVSPKYKTFDALPQGARIGTSSLRRKAQLLAVRSDLEIVDIRGNVETRLKKIENEGLDAVVLAVAGLKRLGLAERITEVLDPMICLPAVGQGVLAIEARADDEEIAELLVDLEDADTRAAITAERAFLARVEGGCQVPVAVFGEVEGERLLLQATIVSVDGSESYHHQLEGFTHEAEYIGSELAERLLRSGAKKILQEIGLLLGE